MWAYANICMAEQISVSWPLREHICSEDSTSGSHIFSQHYCSHVQTEWKGKKIRVRATEKEVLLKQRDIKYSYKDLLFSPLNQSFLSVQLRHFLLHYPIKKKPAICRHLFSTFCNTFISRCSCWFKTLKVWKFIFEPGVSFDFSFLEKISILQLDSVEYYISQ